MSTETIRATGEIQEELDGIRDALKQVTEPRVRHVLHFRRRELQSELRVAFARLDRETTSSSSLSKGGPGGC